MPIILETRASLRFFGDDLAPDDLTACLGAPPHVWARKGEFMRSRNCRRHGQVVARTGRWSYAVEPRRPGDLDGQIREVFGALTSDIDVWQALAARFDADLFVGLFMGTFNECFEISPDCLVMLGERGVTLSLDIYGSENDPDGLIEALCAPGRGGQRRSRRARRRVLH